MTELEKVLSILSMHKSFTFGDKNDKVTVEDIIAMLKGQKIEPETFSPKPDELCDETKLWLDGMTAEERLREIADICIDWDGYRTAEGLGGLLNEIWAYARYPVKAQEPVAPVVDIDTWKCGNCGHKLEHQELLGDNVLFHEQYDFCPGCGKKVKLDG